MSEPALTDFLLARIAEKEARAPRTREDFYDKPCPRCGRPVSGLGGPLDDEAVRALHPHDHGGLGCSLDTEQWDSLMPVVGPTPEGALMLAECEALRRVVALVDSDELFDGDILRALALPYADHPDYDERWRP